MCLKSYCVLIVLWQVGLVFANVPSIMPNCTKTRTVYRVVQEVRFREVKKNWWRRGTQLIQEVQNVTKPFLEEYPVCCAGYRMNLTLERCQPYCEQVCPKYAVCMQPNTCQCRNGYEEIRETPEATSFQCLPMATVSQADFFEETEASILATTDYELTYLESSTELSSYTTTACTECPEYATCTKNGTCVCEPGYVWQEMSTTMSNGMEVNDYQPYCLPQTEIVTMMPPEKYWSDIFTATDLLIVLGVVLASALMAILYWCYKRRIIKLQLSDKKDSQLTCKYTTKTVDGNNII